MKSVFMLLALVSFSNTALSNIDLDLNTVNDGELTDTQAKALGMQQQGMNSFMGSSDFGGSMLYKASEMPQRTIDQKFKFKDEHLDLASVVVVINKAERFVGLGSGQTASVYKDGVHLYTFDVSTGTEKNKTTTSGRVYKATTPKGIYRPTRAYKEYHSSAFRNAPMKHAVFFIGGVALHATTKNSYKRLGKRASGGCVRLTEENAEIVNELIRSTGDGSSNLVDASYNGLVRSLYTDRIQLPFFDKYTGELREDKVAWTYDTAIIVTD